MNLRFYLLLIFSLICFYSKSQDSTNKSKNEFITPGLSYSSYYTIPFITKSNWNKTYVNYNDSLTDIKGQGQLSSGFGLMAYFNVAKRFGIRTGIHYFSREFDLKYHRTNSITDLAKIEMEYIALPITFCGTYLKTEKINLTALAGSRVIFNVSPDKQDRPKDITVDFGIGIERVFYKDLLHSNLFGIELKYSHGFRDIIATRNNIYNLTIDKLTLGMFDITIYIRG